MTNKPNNAPVHVTAKERPHPALQKLARALIALARLQREESDNQAEQAPVNQTSAASAAYGPEVRNG